jgi:hypothetical protein
MMPDLPTLERTLRDVRQEVRNLQVMQMRPGQSAEKLALLRELEMSARAETKLRQKALDHARKRSVQARHAATSAMCHKRSWREGA